ncbi:hypothetical protein DRN93_04885 [archaeon]|nr:MAG: hypothetical protein DRN93_04885 [archaeon]
MRKNRPRVKDRKMIMTIDLEAGLFAGAKCPPGVYGIDERGEIFKRVAYITEDLEFEWRWYVLPRGYEWLRVAKAFKELGKEAK